MTVEWTFLVEGDEGSYRNSIKLFCFCQLPPQKNNNNNSWTQMHGNIPYMFDYLAAANLEQINIGKLYYPFPDIKIHGEIATYWGQVKFTLWLQVLFAIMRPQSSIE